MASSRAELSLKRPTCFTPMFPVSADDSSGHLVRGMHHGRNDHRKNPLQRERLYPFIGGGASLAASRKGSKERILEKREGAV